MYPGDIPSYSPPSRAFFTPPLPPEYQNPFADKPTLRGTNNEGLIAVNRRPIPPPSLMPSQDRIPIRPPDLGSNNNDAVVNSMTDLNYAPSGMDAKHRLEENFAHGTVSDISGVERIKALNTPARASGEEYLYEKASSAKGQGSYEVDAIGPNKRQEVLPNIRRILGSKNGDIPAVLLKHVTQRPIITLRQPPSSPIVLIEKSTSNEEIIDADAPSVVSPNINHSKYHPGQLEYYENATAGTTPSAAAAIGDVSATSFSYATTNAGQPGHTGKTTDAIRELGTGVPDQNPIGAAAAATVHTTWAWAWNIHIYLSVVLFTILSVYSLYKLLTYNKLTHLFAQA
nr:MIP05064p [Drosophila melanogaster]